MYFVCKEKKMKVNLTEIQIFMVVLPEPKIIPDLNSLSYINQIYYMSRIVILGYESFHKDDMISWNF